MTHGSLFSGIGGFDLAAQWMGWENVLHCEINPFGRRVLKHYWPKAISYEDIKKTDFTIHRGTVDVLSAGFPCQPFSAAGKRLGTEDDRHLWPSCIRAIREIQPRWVVGENVRGLTNWNGGLVFDEVQADLEVEGYEVLPFLLPACGAGADHRRDRIWFIAYSDRIGFKRGKQGMQEAQTHRYDTKDMFERGVFNSGQGDRISRPRIFRDTNGLSQRLVDITVSSWRDQSIKAFGNAIVPQVAFQLFQAIEQYENK